MKMIMLRLTIIIMVMRNIGNENTTNDGTTNNHDDDNKSNDRL